MAVKTNYEKNGSHYFRTTATVGKDADGKAIRKEFYGKSKKEAEAKRDEYMQKIKYGMAIHYDRVIFGELFHTWLFDVKRISKDIKPSTFQRYESIYRTYIKDSRLYSIKIDDLKSLDIQLFYNNLYESGKRSSQIMTLNVLIKHFFNYAVSQEYVFRNPCNAIEIPGNAAALDEDSEHPSDIEIFSDADLLTLRPHFAKHKNGLLFELSLGSGMRQGELLGLKWKDIDISQNTIAVKRTLKRVYLIDKNGTRELTIMEMPPKSKKSIRTIPIPASLTLQLDKHKIKEIEKHLKHGILFSDDNYVFTTEECKYIDASNLLRAWKRLLRRAGIKERKFHILRHTYASKLYKKGILPKTIQELLGHSDLSMTNIYTHIEDESKKEAIKSLDYLFS